MKVTRKCDDCKQGAEKLALLIGAYNEPYFICKNCWDFKDGEKGVYTAKEIALIEAKIAAE